MYLPIYQIFMRMATRIIDDEICMLGKVWIFRDLICFGQKNEIWSEKGPCGSVGAHIKTGRSPMAQDHFEPPPDPKRGHGMTRNPQKNKKSSRVGQVSNPLFEKLHSVEFP